MIRKLNFEVWPTNPALIETQPVHWCLRTIISGAAAYTGAINCTRVPLKPSEQLADIAFQNFNCPDFEFCTNLLRSKLLAVYDRLQRPKKTQIAVFSLLLYDLFLRPYQQSASLDLPMANGTAVTAQKRRTFETRYEENSVETLLLFTTNCCNGESIMKGPVLK
ncbi:hypothetical protein NPIL_357351 [Nephila pilipes]|uniref:Uncharacterized protein n=1 Tax=Nephila pilipes TaxID=299642 RepID=A0A8X6QB77_NEPPI|nr:hypothetical protein NPIL_357351 [Nephila pilipes]